MPDEKNLFLFDSNQYAEEKDCFGIHTDIANTILNCIEKTRFTKSAFTLGLFGNWGSGKSFIINKVINKLDKKQYQCLYVDVWKYIGHPLSRSILFDIEKQLMDAKVVGFVDGYKNSKEQTLEQILYSDEEIIDNITLTTAEICKQIGGFVKIAGIALFITFLTVFVSHICIDLYSNIAWLSNLIDKISPFLYSGISISAVPVLLSAILKPQFKKLCETIILRRKLKSYTCKPAFSPEQFEEIYADIIKKIGKKTVIVFDNLDRCESVLAYETLSTIKTFMDKENCFYIIPCDDNAIKNYIVQKYNLDFENDSIDCALEFFDKLFSTYVRIPVLKEEDRDAFIDTQLNMLLLSDSLDSERVSQVKSILFYAYKGNTPRQIKRFLNDLSIYYEFAKKVDPDKQYILADMPMFIIMFVIKQKWPAFEQYILGHPSIIMDIFAKHYHLQDLASEISDVEDIISFLNNIKIYFNEELSPLPYIYMKSSLSNELEIKNKLLNGETFVDVSKELEVIIANQASLLVRNDKNPAYISKMLLSLLNTVTASEEKLFKLSKLIKENLDRDTIWDIVRLDIEICDKLFEFVGESSTSFIKNFELEFFNSIWNNDKKFSEQDIYIRILENVLSNKFIKFEDKLINDIILKDIFLEKNGLGYQYAKLLKQYDKLYLITQDNIQKCIESISTNSSAENIIEVLKEFWDRNRIGNDNRKRLGAKLSEIMLNLYRGTFVNLKAFARGLSLISFEDLTEQCRNNLYVYINQIFAYLSSNDETISQILVELVRFDENCVYDSNLMTYINRYGIPQFINALPAEDYEYLNCIIKHSLLRSRLRRNAETLRNLLEKYKNIETYYSKLLDNNLDAEKISYLNNLLLSINNLGVDIDKKSIADYYIANINNYNSELKIAILDTLNNCDFKPHSEVLDNAAFKNNSLKVYYDDPNTNYRLLKSISNFLTPANFSKNYLLKIFNTIKDKLVNQGQSVAEFVEISQCLNDTFAKSQLELLEEVLVHLLQGGRTKGDYDFAFRLVDVLKQYKLYDEGKFGELLKHIN